VLGFGLSKLCFEGPEAELTETLNAQPAILATTVALMRAVESELGTLGVDRDGSEGGEAVFVAGHSMGEYSALVAAGSLTYADALRLTRRRGELMKAAGDQRPGLMAAVLGLDDEKVAEICAEQAAAGGVVQVANYNCPGQIVISGERAAMEAAMEALNQAGARKVTPLAISIAAHSQLMGPAAEELNAAIHATPIQAPQVPVVGNTTASFLTTVDELRAELAAQLTGSVRWTASMKAAVQAGATHFIEIGPGEVLAGLMKRIEREAKRFSVHDGESVRAIAGVLKEQRQG
jgi:[acyl-carrier-protein] S-malonyltransferase